METTEIAIVGAGLCGLAIAADLGRAGREFRLIEARDRPGGRILSLEGPQGGRFDLGPTWIWPHNRRIQALARRFGLAVYPQYSKGHLVFEDRNGTIRRDLAFATMGDALRIAGGTARLVEALHREIEPARLLMATRLRRLRLQADHVVLDLEGAQGTRALAAGRVILAIPPRLIAGTIAIEPAPPPAIHAALSAMATWMAGHAKLVACYERPFWREAGLSGDAISHRGPLVEIHDASDETSGAAALFGFLAPGGIAELADLERRAIRQLERLFGAPAADPARILIKDWAADSDTAVPADRTPPASHPVYGLPATIEGWAGARLILAGSETAREDGGFLEGALKAAESALARA